MIWIKRFCLFLGAALLISVIAAALWFGSKIFFYQQQDNETHLLEKQSYLEKIGKLDRAAGRPNVVFILFDDLGYGDLGFTGSTAIRTPAMDELARDGVNMTQYYSPAPVCTPARAGLLTGRFPVRAGMPNVVFPSSSPISNIGKLSGTNNRFPAEEITIADALKAAGYATGMVGKWHLGDQSPSLPNDMGFDSFFGALYSNDMVPFALYRDRNIEVKAPADQTRLNEWYGNEAERFIEQNKSRPFFLYFAHNYPHIPLYTPDDDKGRSSAGVYGDVVEGLDDVVARVTATLKANGVFENTILLISSDNGPWYQGSPGNSRGRKADAYEGGVHVPMIVNWPAKLKGGKTLKGISMGMDWFPTLLDWLNIPLPTDRIIDGKSLTAMLERAEKDDGLGESLEEYQNSPHSFLYFFQGEKLQAIRNDRYKYFGKHKFYYGGGNMPVAAGIPKGPWLFDTVTDHNESYDVSMTRAELTQSMQKVLAAKQLEMIENTRGWLR
ncbi:MAG: sulfatase [Pseudomonadales bacterium]